MMIPDTRQRLEAALQELQSTLVCKTMHVILQQLTSMRRASRCVVPVAESCLRARATRWLEEVPPSGVCPPTASLRMTQAESAEEAADTEELAQAQQASRQAQALLAAAEPS
jgi:hypothetical protein